MLRLVHARTTVASQTCRIKSRVTNPTCGVPVPLSARCWSRCASSCACGVSNWEYRRSRLGCGRVMDAKLSGRCVARVSVPRGVRSPARPTRCRCSDCDGRADQGAGAGLHGATCQQDYGKNRRGMVRSLGDGSIDARHSSGEGWAPGARSQSKCTINMTMVAAGDQAELRRLGNGRIRHTGTSQCAFALEDCIPR